MDQNESSVPRRDACGRQRETHGRKDMTLRRRNFSFPSEERSKTLQLKIRMMNFNKFRRRKGPAWTISEQEKARSSHSGSSKSCTLETADSNQPQNSGVRDILYNPVKSRIWYNFPLTEVYTKTIQPLLFLYQDYKFQGFIMIQRRSAISKSPKITLAKILRYVRMEDIRTSHPIIITE